MRLWGGRFEGATDPLAADSPARSTLDRALAPDDLKGSIAHVHGLERAGLVTEARRRAGRGLEALRDEIAAGTFTWDPSLEDVHLNLEAALAGAGGAVAGKLHTGRSRNDQVATDLRLWLRRTVAALDGRLDGPRTSAGRAGRERTRRPCCPARPISSRPNPCCSPTTCWPTWRCWSATAAAWPMPPVGRTSRRSDPGPWPAPASPSTARRSAVSLGFDGVTRNSLDAVADRDFAVEFLAAAALAAVHVSRLAEELTWWANPAFGFVQLADAFSTGSSMMPHKRNPDPAELVRAKAARVAGDLATVAGHPQGPAAGLPARPAGDRRGRCSTGPPSSTATLAVMAGLVASCASMRRAWRPPPATGSPPPPPSPTCWSSAACRSASPITSSAASWPSGVGRGDQPGGTHGRGLAGSAGGGAMIRWRAALAADAALPGRPAPGQRQWRRPSPARTSIGGHGPGRVAAELARAGRALDRGVGRARSASVAGVDVLSRTVDEEALDWARERPADRSTCPKTAPRDPPHDREQRRASRGAGS